MIGRATDDSCSTRSGIPDPMPTFTFCLSQTMGRRPAQPHLLQIRSSARNRADSLLTHIGSRTLRMSPVDPKSTLNLLRRPRTAAARHLSLVTAAPSPDGGGMARNYSIFLSMEN